MDATFADLLRRHRRAAGLTQQELAERSGLSVDAVSTLERGRRRTPRRDTVALLAEALRLTEAERDVLATSARQGSGAVKAALRWVPVPPTPLVGRAAELERARSMLRSGGARLVTLTGPAGAGKTRLALEVVAGLGEDFPAGVRFVDLAPIAEPDLVGPAVWRALHTGEPPAVALVARLASRGSGRRTLMLLDNFEHVLPAARWLAELMAAWPELHVLVTSREALSVRAECVVLVPPLPLDDAVAVFTERARASVPGFAPAGGDAAAVREICARLDGYRWRWSWPQCGRDSSRRQRSWSGCSTAYLSSPAGPRICRNGRRLCAGPCGGATTSSGRASARSSGACRSSPTGPRRSRLRWSAAQRGRWRGTRCRYSPASWTSIWCSRNGWTANTGSGCWGRCGSTAASCWRRAAKRRRPRTRT